LGSSAADSLAVSTSSGRAGSVSVETDESADSHLRAVLESQPVTLVRLAKDGTFLAVNEAGLAALNAERLDQVLGTSFLKLLPEEERPNVSVFIERVISGPQRRGHILSDHEKELIATHEVSHCVVAEAIGQEVAQQKISIVARGRNLGSAAVYTSSDRMVLQRDDLIMQLVTIMAGAAGEQLYYGQLSTGVEGDLDRAAKLARSMVVSYGMSPEFGPVSIGEKAGEVFLGRDIQNMGNISPVQLELPIHGMHPPFEPTPIARQRRVFVNRNLKMGGIDWVGFDMDYTLAIYNQVASLGVSRHLGRAVTGGVAVRYLTGRLASASRSQFGLDLGAQYQGRHLRLGAAPRPVLPKSLRIAATIRDWEMWTGMRSPESVFRRACRPCPSTRTSTAANIGIPTCGWCIGCRRSRPSARHQVRAGRPILSAWSCCGQWWDYPAARLSTASARAWSRLTGNG